MSDRRNSPPGAGGHDDGARDSRGSDDAQFGWLYGKRDRTPPSGVTPENPEHTRVIPVQQRPAPTSARPIPAQQPAQQSAQQSAQQAPRTATPPRSPQPSGVPGAGAGSAFVRFWLRFWGRRLRNPFFYLRFVSLVITLWIVYTIAVPFITWKSVDKVAWEPDGDRPAEQPGTTYLLVGSDSRGDLSKAERRKYHTGNHTENLSDTIMLLHTGDGPNVLLSIPRDSYVPIPKHGTAQINHAYGLGGPQLLTRTIEYNTGIRIDKYVEIGLGGVPQVVDAVGGVEICPKSRIRDKKAGLRIKKGCQTVDGRVALAYSRARYSQAHSDLDRVRHQREVVAAIGDKVLSPWSVLNPFRWWDLNHAVPAFFAFGEGMGTIDAGKWALAMSHTTGKKGMTCTMPVQALVTPLRWDLGRAKAIFSAFIDDKTDDITPKQCTPTGLAGVK